MTSTSWYDRYYQVLRVVSEEMEPGESFHSSEIAEVLEEDAGTVGNAIKEVAANEDNPEIGVGGRDGNRLRFEYRGGSPPDDWKMPQDDVRDTESFRSWIRESAERYSVELSDASVFEAQFQPVYEDVMDRLATDGAVEETRLETYIQGHPRLQEYSFSRRLQLAGRIARQMVEGVRDIEIRRDGGGATYAMV